MNTLKVIGVCVALFLAGCLNWEFRYWVGGPVWRLLTGGLIFARMSPWHSTWLRPAPPRPERRPNFRGESYPHTAWGRMAGWRRMLIRWAATGYVVALYHWRTATLVMSAVVALVLVVRSVVRQVQEWAHARAVGSFAAGAAVVLDRRDDPLSWIAIPRIRLVWLPVVVTGPLVDAFDGWPALQRRVASWSRHLVWLDKLAIPMLRVPLAEDDAEVLVAVESTVVRQDIVKEIGRLGMARIPDGPWNCTYRESELTVVFRHPKRPPSHVQYDEDAHRAFRVDEVPIGQKAGGTWATLPLKKLTPHTVMAATTGWCKTSTANVYVAHTAGNGGQAFIHDPKRVGFPHFDGLSNVVIRTTPDGWAEGVNEFLAEMERRYELIERYPQIKDDPELYFQPWFLIVDERGSYVSDLRDRARREGEKGLPLTLRQEKKIWWQGRAAGMYVLNLCQQANLSVFTDSDGRDQHMARIASGPQSRSSWFMLFPGVAKRSTAMKKGRAFLSIGVDAPEEIQLAQISDADAREFAAAGSAIAERENRARAERLAALIEGEDSASTRAGSPGATAPDVRPEDRDGGTSKEIAEPRQGNILGIVPAQRQETNESASDDVSRDNSEALLGEPSDASDTGEEESIVGIKAAAEYLEMGEEAFKKARQRRPIRGEFRNGITPAWRPLDLREWRNQAPRAGGAA